ncbi:hypothetical protein EJB05_17432, partial [Eragrostis curvula]
MSKPPIPLSSTSLRRSSSRDLASASIPTNSTTRSPSSSKATTPTQPSPPSCAWSAPVLMTRDDGVDTKVLLSDVALRLHVPRPPSLSWPFITGRLNGADFGAVTLVAYAADDDYAYAADTAFSCPPPPAPARDGRHVFDGGFSCPRLRVLLRGSYSLDYGRAASGAAAAPLRLRHRRMHVNRMSCAADGSVRAYIAFYADRPESFPSNHSVWWRENSSVFLVGDEALVADGFWDASRSQLCLRACRVAARADVAVRECGIGVSFWFPGVWSFRDRRTVAGLIWNASDGDADGKTSLGAIAASRTERHTYTGDLSDMKYNYTRVEEATKQYDHSKPVLSWETKAGRIPGSSYSRRDFGFRFVFQKNQGLSGSAWPVTIGSALLEGDWLTTEHEFSQRVAAEVNNRSLLSVSYHLEYQVPVRGVNSHEMLQEERRITAEGVYDTQTGHMCMLACQEMDCEVLVTVQFAPIEAESRDRAAGTISSLRNQSDPLFFEALDFVGGGMYRVQVVDLASRMEAEGVMMVVTAVLSSVLTALQMHHAWKHRDAIPATSVTMLVVLAMGNLLPLLFNFEPAVLAWHDLFYQLHLSRTSSLALRASTILAFVLLLRLLQLTLSRRRSAEARRDDGSASSSSAAAAAAAAERNTVRVCLSLYIVGAVLMLFANVGDGRGQLLINATGPKLAEALAYYGGLILDAFLLPQVILNAFSGVKTNALSPWFYVGGTVNRAGPHLYNVFWPAPHVFGVVWDVDILCGAALLAALLFLQQRHGGALEAEAESAGEALPNSPSNSAWTWPVARSIYLAAAGKAATPLIRFRRLISSPRGIRATSSRFMAPCFPCPNCSLTMVVYDPAADKQRAEKPREEEEEEGEEASTSSSSVSKRSRQEEEASASSSGASAIVPHAVLDVEPINAAPPQHPPPHGPPLPARPVPPCLREHFLPALGLRRDLPVHFIVEKVVTSTDLNPHQNRFRIPGEGVDNNLKPILTLAELEAANLLDDIPPKKRPPKPKKPADGGAAQEAGKKVKKPKKKGKPHGGLRVKLVDLTAGASKELRMTRWASSRGTVVKGEGFVDFIRRCSLRANDAVDIWAFVQRRLRLFGVDVYDDSVLHVFVVKQHQPPDRCCYCPIPHAH